MFLYFYNNTMYEILSRIFWWKELNNLKKLTAIVNQVNSVQSHYELEMLKHKLLHIDTIEHKDKADTVLSIIETIWKFRIQYIEKQK